MDAMESPFDLLALILGNLSILAVGAVAWRRNRHSGAARAFFMIGLTFTAWSTASYLSLHPTSAELATFFNRLSYAAGMWPLLATWYFCFRFPGEQRPGGGTKALLAGWLVAGTLLSFSPFVVKEAIFQGGLLIIIPGRGYATYGLLLAALAFSALVNLKRNYSSADLVQRNQIRYAAFGVGTAVFLAIFFNVVMVLWDPRWGSPLVNLALTLLFVIFIGYGLVRHHYADIHVLLAWIFTYSICLALAVGWLALAAAGSSRLYPGSAGTQQAVLALAAAAAVFALQPIKKRLKLWADQLLNVGWYDTQTLLNTISTMLAGEMRLIPLLKHSLRYLGGELKVTGGELLCLNEKNNPVAVQFGTWPNPPGVEDIIKLPRTHKVVVMDDLAADNSIRRQLERYGIRVSVPLETRGRLVGYIFLGVKQNGDIFSETDINMLQILSNQLAVAIVSAQAYEQISQFNSTLQKEVSQATASLRKAHEKLRLDDRMKTEFIILTSHSLRTPLSIIKGYASLLEDSHLNEAQRKLLDSLKDGAERLSQFTEDLLAIDSIVAGNQLELQPANAKDILLPLIKEAEDLAKTKGIEFKTDIRFDGIYINANVPRLSGALRNLLENAFKFTSHGYVSLSAMADGKNARIIIADTGIGISAKELPRLFTKFHRATGTLEYNYEGEGIGLYLTNLVVKEHGGHIKATSHLNRGSRFEITLPLASGATNS